MSLCQFFVVVFLFFFNQKYSKIYNLDSFSFPSTQKSLHLLRLRSKSCYFYENNLCNALFTFHILNVASRNALLRDVKEIFLRVHSLHNVL